MILGKLSDFKTFAALHPSLLKNQTLQLPSAVFLFIYQRISCLYFKKLQILELLR
jgi:hypothetical protein